MTRDTPSPSSNSNPNSEERTDGTSDAAAPFDPFHTQRPGKVHRRPGAKPGRPAHLPTPRDTPRSLPRPRPVRRGGMR